MPQNIDDDLIVHTILAAPVVLQIPLPTAQVTTIEPATVAGLGPEVRHAGRSATEERWNRSFDMAPVSVLSACCHFEHYTPRSLPNIFWLRRQRGGVCSLKLCEGTEDHTARQNRRDIWADLNFHTLILVTLVADPNGCSNTSSHDDKV